jgi:hypothetical protein
MSWRIRAVYPRDSTKGVRVIVCPIADVHNADTYGAPIPDRASCRGQAQGHQVRNARESANKSTLMQGLE